MQTQVHAWVENEINTKILLLPFLIFFGEISVRQMETMRRGEALNE